MGALKDRAAQKDALNEQQNEQKGMGSIIDFMRFRIVAAVLSTLLVLGSIVSLAMSNLEFGLDFTGGVLVEVEYENAPVLNEVRANLQADGYKDVMVQTFGSPTDIMVRLGLGDLPVVAADAAADAAQSEESRDEESHNNAASQVGDHVLASLKANADGEVIKLRSEYVGPQVGEELREQGGLGMLMALFVVMLYVAFRFQLKFSIGAVAALAHDVLIVLGIFSLLHLEFDLTVLAAVLAVIGYSLNDTIVVSDRIRENFRKVRKGTVLDIINLSLTQTLGRTLVTSLTTLLVLVALFYFGGELIHGFATALMVGVIVGTYSSVYVASNVLVAMNISREDLIPPPKEDVLEGEFVEGEGFEERP